MGGSCNHKGKNGTLKPQNAKTHDLCDGHVESPPLALLFSDTSDDSLCRWNATTCRTGNDLFVILPALSCGAAPGSSPQRKFMVQNDKSSGRSGRKIAPHFLPSAAMWLDSSHNKTHGYTVGCFLPPLLG